MKIRTKLIWTFIILSIIGINAIGSYAIIYIKSYLQERGIQELKQHTSSLAATISDLSANAAFQRHFDEITKTSGYQIALYDSTGALLYSYPAGMKAASRLSDDRMQAIKANNTKPVISKHTKNDKITSYNYLPDRSNSARYIRISQLESHIYAPMKKIRWIIYYGIFASIALAIIVNILVARYLTKPITQIKDEAQDIAGGNVDRQIDVNRHDEFGTLADSLNKMAAKLRRDTNKIKHYAERQQQFFADITHEIRNPLHTISGSLEMFELNGLPSEKKEKYVRDARGQVKRINRLFDDLKTLQQYDADEHFIEKRTFDLAKISEHMRQWHNGEAQKEGLQLWIDNHSCKAVGDPDKIEQVIENLISNAIKYTNEGAIALRYFKKGKNVRVEVTDTGIGISDEHLERLFDRFYRTDKARSREMGGTGLGLAIVKSILEAHGSDIEVESEPGKGSVFGFQLPTG